MKTIIKFKSFDTSEAFEKFQKEENVTILNIFPMAKTIDEEVQPTVMSYNVLVTYIANEEG